MCQGQIPEIVVLYDASGNLISLNTTVNADRTTNLDGVEGLNTNAMVFGRISDSIVKNLRSDSSTESLMTVDYAHHEVHAGTSFFIDDTQTLAINNVFDLIITTPDTTKWPHLIFTISAESETEWYIYEDAVVTVAGTAYTCYNNNRNSATVCTVDLKSHLNTSLANANADTDVSGATLIRHGIVGSGRNNSGTDTRANETILKQNSVYCLRFIANAAGYINFDLTWYEHTQRN